MAKKTTVELVDDLDGKSPADESVEFGIDGVNYEIDLSKKNASELRSVLEPYAVVGRRSGGRKHKAKSNGQAAMSREQSTAIRDWANANGYTVSKRGRIASDVVEAFQASA